MYGVILRSKKDYVFLPLSYIGIGAVFTISSILYLLSLKSLIIISFFGGMMAVLLFMSILKNKLRKERVQLITHRLKKIDQDERIKLSDIFKRKLIHKLILKNGPKFAAKVLTVFIGLCFCLSLTFFYSLRMNTSISFILVNIVISFTIFSLFFYFIIKRLFEDTYDNYSKKYSNDDFS